MLRKQKTREVGKNFAGSKTGHLEKIRWQKDNGFCPAIQEKCVRCPCFPGMGYACNVPCPFTVRGACAVCIHFLTVDEHRNKARCVWTGARLDAGEVERVRECIGFEEKTGLDLCRSLRQGEVPLNLARRSNRLFCFPRAGKSIAAYTAISHSPAGNISGGRYVHIGRVIRPGLREGPAASLRPGSVSPCLFLFPKLSEVPHA